MNLLYKLLGVQKIQRKAMSFPGFSIGAAPTYFNWNKNSDAYVTSDTIYTIIKTLGRKAASIPLESYRKAERNVKSAAEDNTSNLYKLVQRPNPSQGADSFWEGVFSFYALKGEAFIWLNRGGIEGGEPIEMYYIAPELMTAVPDPLDMYGVKYWILNANGALIPIQKEDIIHWKTFNPDFDMGTGSHLRGLSPLIPATRRLQQDNDSMDSAVAMFQNGGAKGVLFNKDYVDLTPDQKSQLESVIKDKVNNKLVKASVAALQGEWGYLDLGLSGVDMQLLGSQELTLKRLCAMFGVPYELFQSDTTFANKEMAMKSFIVNTIQPMCRSLADELNRVLIPAFKGGYYLEFDFSSVPELQNDLTKLGATYQAMFDRGAITLNEYRKLMGFDETTNPDHNNYFISGNYAPLTDLNIPNEPDLGQDGL